MPLPQRLGLHRPELRAWAMYDWATSAMQTVIMTAVFPIFFVKVAGANLPAEQATQQLSLVNSIALTLVAIASPILGAISDLAGNKKRLLAGFMLAGVLATGSMYWIGHGELGLASALFIISMIGATGSFVFYESLLPHIAAPAEIDRVSTAGFALGYLGGGVLLALNLAWIQKPEWFGLPSGPGLTPSEATLPARLAFVSVAVWWGLFSIPLFRQVPEPPRRREPDEPAAGRAIFGAFPRLGETLRELRGFRHAFIFLLAFLLYNDGIQTIIKMATAYGTEIGIGAGALIGAILIVQFVGIPCAFLFGMLAGKIGAKRAIFIGLLAYTGISVLGYFMTNATHFYILAGLVGVVQGGTQALSRSLFASMVPKHKSGEFFGFFSVFEKFAGILGPLFFYFAIELTGSSRSAILSIIAFFAVGAVLLAKVDPAEGARAARAADAEAEALAA
jgi:UMF1 family MFS transporter